MIIRFNSFNEAEVPSMFLCGPGCRLNLDGSLSNPIGTISNINDIEASFNFNAPSEFNFRVYDYKLDNYEQDLYARVVFNNIKNKQSVYVDDIGFFLITEVKTTISKNVRYKDIRITSADSELENIGVPYIEDGTYSLQEIMEKIVSKIPMWTVAEFDPSKIDIYNPSEGTSTNTIKKRTFEDISIEDNVLKFLTEEVQEAFECIFKFDITNRIIIAYDQDKYVEESPIQISAECFGDSISIRENSEDVYTALSIYGDNDLTISPINIIGGNVIYNFEYFYDYMSPDLKTMVDSWEAAINENESNFVELATSKYEYLNEQNNIKYEIERLQSQIDIYRRCRENIIAEKDTLSVEGYNTTLYELSGEAIVISEDIGETLVDIDNKIAQASALATEAQREFENLQVQIAEIDATILEYRNTYSIQDYFGIPSTNSDYQYPTYFDELQNYIFEGSYTDQYSSITDSMSIREQFNQMKTLYDRAIKQIKTISEPNQEYTVDLQGFVFDKDLLNITSELDTGKVVYLELADSMMTHMTYDANADEYVYAENSYGDNTIQVFVSNITINYTDKSLRITFGNKFNRFDPKQVFSDALGDITKSSNSIDYIKQIIYPVKNGALGAMSEAIRNSRILTKNSVISSSGEEIIIDDTGYTGRRKTSDGEIDPHQIKITGRTIAFTDDAWDTSKTALGEIILDEDTTVYGINAETIIGDMIIGNNLNIYTSDSSGNRSTLFEVMDGKIDSRIEETADRISEIEQTAEAVSIRIDGIEAVVQDPDHVTTKANKYVFDDSGLHISNTTNDIYNKIDETGMYVSRGNGYEQEDVLVANNDGVEAINLTAKQYLIAGHHARFEDYHPGNKHRTACFYINTH